MVYVGPDAVEGDTDNLFAEDDAAKREKLEAMKRRLAER